MSANEVVLVSADDLSVANGLMPNKITGFILAPAPLTQILPELENLAASVATSLKPSIAIQLFKAGNAIRTRDIHLGKVTLYH